MASSRKTSTTIDGIASNLKNDIGFFVNATMEPAEILQVVKNMPSGQKYHLIKHHFQPSKDYILPSEYCGGCYRSFKLEWLTEFPTLVYSEKLDGGFCLPCALFCENRKHFGLLVNWPFWMWNHKSDKMAPHFSKEYHMDAVAACKVFVESIEKPQGTVPP